jgi:SnoaL-like domain
VTLSVEARFELRELVDSYAMAVDALDADWFSSLWTPDAVLAVHDATGEVRRWHGDEIGGMVAGVRRYLRTFHFVGNHRAQREGDVVSGQTYCFAHHLHEGTEASGGSTRDRVVAIRYDDRYERGDTDGRWRFARRDVRMLWRAHHDVELLGYEA